MQKNRKQLGAIACQYVQIDISTQAPFSQTISYMYLITYHNNFQTTKEKALRQQIKQIIDLILIINQN